MTYEQDLEVSKKALPDYTSVGNLVDAITVCYTKADYIYPEDKENLPLFLTEAIGPPLQTLHAFHVAGIGEQHTMTGFGRALDVIHAEMRNMGKRIAGFVFPGIGPMISPKVQGGLMAAVNNIGPERSVSIAGLPLPVKLSPELSTLIVQLGGIAHGYKNRPADERAMLNKSVHTAHELYNLMGEIHTKLKTEIDKARIEQGVPEEGFAAQAGLNKMELNLPLIQQTFAKHREDLKTVRVFLKMAMGNEFPAELDTLCWGADELFPEDKLVQTPKDAACAVFSLCFFGQMRQNTELFDRVCLLSNRVAKAQTNEEAVAILSEKNSCQILNTLKNRIEKGSLPQLKMALTGLYKYGEDSPCMAAATKRNYGGVGV
jgi:hypothetical protein